MANKRNEKRVLCIGMCVLDIVHVCEVFPVEDTDKRCISGYWQRGGNASNNCTVLRQLNVACEFLGMLSDSPAFGFLVDDCRKRQIYIDNCPRVKQDPPFSSVILVQNSDSRTIIHSNSSFPILNYEHFKNIRLNEYKWIHFEARNVKETLQMLHAIHAYNKSKTTTEEKIRISIEFEKISMDNFVLMPWTNLIFLAKDLALHMGWQKVDQAVHGLRALLSTSAYQNNNIISDDHIPDIVCPWGAHGSGCLNSNNEYTYIAAVPPKVIVDSLGAGDTFCAAVIYALSEQGWLLPEAVAFANQCASFKIAHRGYDAIADFRKPLAE